MIEKEKSLLLLMLGTDSVEEYLLQDYGEGEERPDPQEIERLKALIEEMWNNRNIIRAGSNTFKHGGGV